MVSRTRVIEALLIVIAATCALTPLPQPVVERLYSTSVYPLIQRAVTPVSNLLPFAVLDILIVAAAVPTIVAIARAFRTVRRTRRLAPLVTTLGHLAAAAAVVYLAFLVLWGLNYQRVRMQNRVVTRGAAPTRQAVVELGLQSVRRMNELHDAAHRIGWGTPEWHDDQLRGAFQQVLRRLSDAPPAEPGRLKWTILGPYLRWASVDGLVDPFALEVLTNPDLLPWERPFVAAHEWSHLAGYAYESEANFVGWVTCLRASVPSQYSGWLFLYWEVNGQLGADDRARLSRAMNDGPRRDVDAIVERLRRGQLPLLQHASWAVYDGYLRANHVESGIRSYDEVVTLILRAAFEDGWLPVRRTASTSSR